MKKLTAMLLSLVMCFSLMAIPVQAAFIPDPDGPGIVDAGGPKDSVTPGDEDPDEPGDSIQLVDDGLPDHRGDIPTD